MGAGSLVVVFGFGLFASSYKGFGDWFYHVLADLVFWCLTPDCSFFCWVVYCHPDHRIYFCRFPDALITRLAHRDILRKLCRISQAAASATHVEVQTL